MMSWLRWKKWRRKNASDLPIVSTSKQFLAKVSGPCERIHRKRVLSQNDRVSAELEAVVEKMQMLHERFPCDEEAFSQRNDVVVNLFGEKCSSAFASIDCISGTRATKNIIAEKHTKVFRALGRE
jgi:hypothetical protein